MYNTYAFSYENAFRTTSGNFPEHERALPRGELPTGWIQFPHFTIEPSLSHHGQG